MIEACIIIVGLAVVIAVCIAVGLELAQWLEGKR